MFHLANVPIIMHFVLELMAISSFFRQPGLQLHDPNPSREAVLVCHSYAGTLLTLNVICGMYMLLEGVGRFGPIGTALAWSLSTYHVFPMFRAWDRMQRRAAGGNDISKYDIGGGPKANFRGHLLLFVSLVSAGIFGLLPVD